MTRAQPAATAWWQGFPALAALDDPIWRAIRQAASVVQVPAGTSVFHSGDVCQHYMLVLEGSVRVQKLAENGREITLYRVESGGSCILTTSCLLARERYPAEGITETEVVAALIPLPLFEKGLDQSPGFRRFVFSTYAQRISHLILLVEEVAFGRIDGRLAQRLLELRNDAGVVEATHQVLAAELGTAREVVSRQLKEFERRGWIALQRGRVEIISPEPLGRLVGSG
jgi:CRP/FNR family transcriptional regulator